MRTWKPPQEIGFAAKPQLIRNGLRLSQLPTKPRPFILNPIKLIGTDLKPTRTTRLARNTSTRITRIARTGDTRVGRHTRDTGISRPARARGTRVGRHTRDTGISRPARARGTRVGRHTRDTGITRPARNTQTARIAGAQTRDTRLAGIARRPRQASHRTGTTNSNASPIGNHRATKRRIAAQTSNRTGTRHTSRTQWRHSTGSTTTSDRTNPSGSGHPTANTGSTRRTSRHTANAGSGRTAPTSSRTGTTGSGRTASAHHRRHRSTRAPTGTSPFPAILDRSLLNLQHIQLIIGIGPITIDATNRHPARHTGLTQTAHSKTSNIDALPSN